MRTTMNHTRFGTSAALDAVVDAARAWLDAGLGRLGASLLSGARAMRRTAFAVDDLRDRLRD